VVVHTGSAAGWAHEDPGAAAGQALGQIGTEPFRALLAHPELADVPFVVETPGGKAGHARDIATLKGLRGTDAAGRG
jgi:deoxyribonuclease-4